MEVIGITVVDDERQVKVSRKNGNSLDSKLTVNRPTPPVEQQIASCYEMK